MTSLTLQRPLRLFPTPVRWVAFFVWAALAASAVYWGVKLFSRAEPVPAQVITVAAAQTSQGDPMRLFGAPRIEAPLPVVAPASNRFRLFGVVAPTTASSSQAGVATLSIDGGPARAYRVGMPVDGQWVVQSISQRGVQIGPRDGAAAAVLDMPALQPAAVGSLPTGLTAPGGEPMVGPGPDMPPMMMEPPSAGRRSRGSALPGSVPIATPAAPPTTSPAVVLPAVAPDAR